MDYPIKCFDQYAGQNSDEQLGKLKADGFGAAIHYYGGSTAKRLSPTSARQLTQAGFLIGVVYESGGNELEYFTSDQGVEDAKNAIAQAQWVGQPAGSAIYFAVDTGVTAEGFTNNVLPYFGGVAAIMASATAATTITGYRVGAYACGLVLTGLFQAKLISYDWLSGAMGWPGSRGYISPFDISGKPAIIQGLEGMQDGIDMDPDTVYREAGLFQLAA